MNTRYERVGAMRIGIALCAICSVAALAGPWLCTPLPRIVYNASDSVPPGWYLVDAAAAPRTGRFVLARLPADAAALAAQRRYLPSRVPLLKPVAAVAPHRLCMRDRKLSIDGITVGVALTADRLGRPLPLWSQCRRLRDGELFLLSTTNPASFDSRYFGPISVSDVLGVARPLWTWDSR
ncbi:S26 family signal peptidase [Solimonas terrae]|uniref:S26 family signal peptidase n=1 Tax=Solimonas terrae TaxID=1396819 RepID=A0A6M2BVF4_9GAMM|nr:S26 family signal peptidase [Solimonas terrae]NGY05937.1 S26 family signal peptidase [Solimonas terrae]